MMGEATKQQITAVPEDQLRSLIEEVRGDMAEFPKELPAVRFAEGILRRLEAVIGTTGIDVDPHEGREIGRKEASWKMVEELVEDEGMTVQIHAYNPEGSLGGETGTTAIAAVTVSDDWEGEDSWRVFYGDSRYLCLRTAVVAKRSKA